MFIYQGSSEHFINDIPENTIADTMAANVRIMSSPAEIMVILKEKETEKPNSARMVAGFCWPWSSKTDANGDLIKDVRIGDFAMPWETHDKITRTPPGYVKWFEWAYRPEGIKQVGCIYTAQGFEFDYIGVIIGNDLRYDGKASAFDHFSPELIDHGNSELNP